MKHFVSQYRLLHIVLGAVFVLFCVPGLGQAQIEQPEFRPMDFSAICQYDYEQSRKPLAIVEDNIRIANSQQKAMIEQKLIGLIESATATLPAKDFACRLLRRIGTEASIEALGDALENEDTFDMARFALEGMESKEVDALFRRILKRADGAYRLGMISSIANRGDEKAVRLIARYLDEEDMALKEAAIQALGRIGGDRALRELQRSDDIPKSLNPVFYDSLLLCADKYIAMDQERKAEKLFKKLSGKSYPDNIRVAAINGLVQARGEHVAGTIARLVKDDNPTIRKAAINEFVTDLSNTEAAEELIEVMDDVEADTQVLIIKTLVSRNERLAHREIYELTMADEPAVQNEAIRALGKLGDASYVPHLIEFAVEGGDTGRVAQDTVRAMPGDVNAELNDLLEHKNAGMRRTSLQCLIEREPKNLHGLLVQSLSDSSAMVRKEAITGMKEFGTQDDFPTLLDIMLAAEDAGVRNSAQQAVQVIGAKVPAYTRDKQFAKELPTASAANQVKLIELMHHFGGVYSFKAVKMELDSKKDRVQEAALKAMMNWPDGAPLETLKTMAQKAEKDEKRRKALQGFLRSIRLSTSLSEKTMVQHYHDAMKIAETRQEKLWVIDAASSRENIGTLKFLEKYLKDKQVGKVAQKAYRELVDALQNSQVSKESMRVTASHNKGAAKNAIDGNMDTRWDTSASQTPGMWFQVDLGASMTLQKVIIDCTGSNNDYPDAYKVYLSQERQSWGDPFAQGDGKRPKLTIDAKGKTARFIRIEQTGKKDGLYWSIHEIEVLKETDSQAIQHAKDVLKKLK